MGELEGFVVCTIKRDLTKTTLNIYQPHIIHKMTQEFNEEVKSLLTFNTPDTTNECILYNQETYMKIS